MPKIVVLRYGHRLVRDYRVTSHTCLVARALGAEKIIINGDHDPSVEKSIKSVVARWGGKFSVEFADSWRKVLQEYKKKGYFVAHLTMYGKALQKEAKTLRSHNKILLIVGSQKVEPAVYELSDLNLSVTQQPHSEIAAMAIAMDWIFDGKELGKKFGNAKIKVLPRAKGKKIVRT
ncbi:MAG: tRNA (cytidine(56)-2'-O)-methyltransferase [archaeon]|jgi:tRNA (cytidine56-2'-O)-methyltransferase|nr:tRNA (cytidine(56)-2'-O)-methyltransferase [archaeon]